MTMKKKYEIPEMNIVDMGELYLLAGSFIEGDTGGSGTGGGTIDPGEALIGDGDFIISLIGE